MHLDNERVTLKAQWPAKSLNESVDRFLLLYQERIWYNQKRSTILHDGLYIQPVILITAVITSAIYNHNFHL